MMSDHADTARRSGMALLPVMPGLDWTEIRAAAVRYTKHGWPVLPGTYQFAEHSGWLGKGGSVGLEPVADLWATAIITDPDAAMDQWTQRPYSVLLACGHTVSAVEVPFARGTQALGSLTRSERGPVVATPSRSCLFLVQASDEPLQPELAAAANVQLHGPGSWLPLPPTRRHGVPYRWQVTPSATEWALPTSADIQRALARTIK